LQSGFFVRVYSLFKAVFQNATLNGTVTRKHRKWVSTSEKPACRQSFFVAVFACREESRTLFWEYPNPYQVPRQNIFKNFASVLAIHLSPPWWWRKGGQAPFHLGRKGGEVE